ncbi:unnamed protein product [Prunus armeniaca]
MGLIPLGNLEGTPSLKEFNIRSTQNPTFSTLLFLPTQSQHRYAFLLSSRGFPMKPPPSVNNPGLSPPRYVVERFSLPTFVGFCLLLAVARICYLCGRSSVDISVLEMELLILVDLLCCACRSRGIRRCCDILWNILVEVEQYCPPSLGYFLSHEV